MNFVLQLIARAAWISNDKIPLDNHLIISRAKNAPNLDKDSSRPSYTVDSSSLFKGFSQHVVD